MTKKNVFIFVVCGDDEHIHTLNFSLSYIRHFTKNEIIVVTDLSRNNIQITHDNIINIDTPANYDHHQASIFIKTKLHKILDMSNLYCYLDSDVIAVSNEIDNVFNYFTQPITFASDHCKIDKFSNNAVNCRCRRDYYEKIRNIDKDSRNEEEFYKHILIKRIKLDKLFKLYHKYDITIKPEEKLKNENNLFVKYFIRLNIWFQLSLKGYLLKKYRTYQNFNIEKFRLKNKDNNLPLKILKYFYLLFTILSKWVYFKLFKINERKIYKIFNRVWKNVNNEVIYSNYPRTVDFMKKFYNYKHDIENNIWYDENGFDIYNYFPKPQNINAPPVISCNHLIHEIYKKFKIRIIDNYWHHWNGGVFLFDSSSEEFMNTWHKFTLDIFKDSKWKVRDQGTLIATVWKYKLQAQPRIPAEYNFIADYYKPEFEFDKAKRFSLDNFKTSVNPFFVHIYYKYGKKGWEVWDFIECILPDNEKDKNSIDFFIKKYTEGN